MPLGSRSTSLSIVVNVLAQRAACLMKSSSKWWRRRSFVQAPRAEAREGAVVKLQAAELPTEYLALTLGWAFVSGILAWVAYLR